MLDFGGLDEIRFGAKRIRVPDGACVTRYTPLHNYVSVRPKKPGKWHTINILKRKYRTTNWNSKLGEPNARWHEVYQAAGKWEIRYGFGVAYYNTH